MESSINISRPVELTIATKSHFGVSMAAPKRDSLVEAHFLLELLI